MKISYGLPGSFITTYFLFRFLQILRVTIFFTTEPGYALKKPRTLMPGLEYYLSNVCTVVLRQHMKEVNKQMDYFLEHPKVQYIPLRLINPEDGFLPEAYNKPAFHIYQNHEHLSFALSNFNLPEMNLDPQFFEDHLAVIALNFEVKRGFFRFLTVKLIGENQEGFFQVFYVTKKYFPRRVLHFTLYTEEGKKVAWKNIDVL